MAEYNNRTNFNTRSNPSDNTNTNGIMLKNHDKHKFLACSHWNKGVVIEIGSIPENAENDFSVLRSVQTIKQVMTFQTLTTLDQILEDALESIKTTGSLSPAGAPAGSKFDNLVEITDGSNLDPQLGLGKGVYLVIYKDWDANRATQKFDIYPFSTRTIIRGYDHNTGRAVEDINKVRDLKDFYLFVHEACKAMTNAQAHAVMDVSKKERTSSIKALSAVAAALGVDIGGAKAPYQKAASSDNNGASRGNGGYQRKSYNGNRYGNNNNNGQSGGYRNGYTGYRGGSTGGFPNRQNSQKSNDTPFAQDNGVDLELNMKNLSDLPIDQFV